MIRIDRLRLRLPRGFEHRASSIAYLVGESMATMTPTESRDLESLSVGPIQVSASASDQQIAQSVAGLIARSLGVRK